MNLNILLLYFVLINKKATYSSLHDSWAKLLKSGTPQCKAGVSFLFVFTSDLFDANRFSSIILISTA